MQMLARGKQPPFQGGQGERNRYTESRSHGAWHAPSIEAQAMSIDAEAKPSKQAEAPNLGNEFP